MSLKNTHGPHRISRSPPPPPSAENKNNGRSLSPQNKHQLQLGEGRHGPGLGFWQQTSRPPSSRYRAERVGAMGAPLPAAPPPSQRSPPSSFLARSPRSRLPKALNLNGSRSANSADSRAPRPGRRGAAGGSGRGVYVCACWGGGDSGAAPPREKTAARSALHNGARALPAAAGITAPARGKPLSCDLHKKTKWLLGPAANPPLPSSKLRVAVAAAAAAAVAATAPGGRPAPSTPGQRTQPPRGAGDPGRASSPTPGPGAAAPRGSVRWVRAC